MLFRIKESKQIEEQGHQLTKLEQKLAECESETKQIILEVKHSRELIDTLRSQNESLQEENAWLRSLVGKKMLKREQKKGRS